MSIEIILDRGISPENRAIRARINPEGEWQKQSQTLASRFAEKLGFSTKEEYIDTLPKIGPRPREFKGILGIPAVPVIVETRIDLPEMLDTFRIGTFFDPREIEDWREGGYETPRKPYAAWLTYIPNKSVIEVRANLPEGQRGGIPFDGIALFLTKPHVLNNYSLHFPGSQVGPEYSAFLSALPNPEWNRSPNHPSLHRGSIDRGSPKFACLIAVASKV